MVGYLVLTLFSRHSLMSISLSSRQRNKMIFRAHLSLIMSWNEGFKSARTPLEISFVSSTTAHAAINTLWPYWSVDICGMISRIDLIMFLRSFAVPRESRRHAARAPSFVWTSWCSCSLRREINSYCQAVIPGTSISCGDEISRAWRRAVWTKSRLMISFFIQFLTNSFRFFAIMDCFSGLSARICFKDKPFSLYC